MIVDLYSPTGFDNSEADMTIYKGFVSTALCLTAEGFFAAGGLVEKIKEALRSLDHTFIFLSF